MSNPERRSWTDWIYYFGSKDERHRQVADRAGHRAFLPVFLVAAADFLIRWPGIVEGGYRDWPQIAASALILFGGGILYTVLWVRGGFTFLDTGRQRKAQGWVGLGAGLTVFLYLGFVEGPLLGLWSWVLAAASTALTLLLVSWLLRLIHRRASAAAEKEIGQD